MRLHFIRRTALQQCQSNLKEQATRYLIAEQLWLGRYVTGVATELSVSRPAWIKISHINTNTSFDYEKTHHRYAALPSALNSSLRLYLLCYTAPYTFQPTFLRKYLKCFKAEWIKERKSTQKKINNDINEYFKIRLKNCRPWSIYSTNLTTNSELPGVCREACQCAFQVHDVNARLTVKRTFHHMC